MSPGSPLSANSQVTAALSTSAISLFMILVRISYRLYSFYTRRYRRRPSQSQSFRNLHPASSHPSLQRKPSSQSSPGSQTRLSPYSQYPEYAQYVPPPPPPPVTRARVWYADDSWMAFAMLPLLGRATCIVWREVLLRQAAERGLGSGSDEVMLATKLLLPARVFYALFLWSVKLCLLELYSRITESIPLYQTASRIFRYCCYLTFVLVVLATFLECRPIELFWNTDPRGAKCRKGQANLWTMAVCNIITDLALVIFPIPLLWKIPVDFKKKIQLFILFSMASLVIITTFVRVPLIVQDGQQNTRSLWAGIEITCACFVANAAFFYSLGMHAIERRHRSSVSRGGH